MQSPPRDLAIREITTPVPKMKPILISLLMVLSLAGCATVQGSPNADLSLIDTWGVNPAQYERDYSQCAQLANQTNTTGRAIAGMFAGALVGAVVGRSYGYDGGSFARAGAVGGMGAGIGNGEVEKQRALRLCLQHRGYAVIR